jgi:hypothetical protein
MAPTAQEACRFIEALALPEAAQAGPRFETLEALPTLDAGRDQSLLVGSGLVAFTRGVDAQRRQDLANATLLAQLAASKLNADPEDVAGWYRAYQKVLSHVGFAVQDSGFQEFHTRGQALQTHEAILQVAGIALGASPSALALVSATLSALQEGDRFITLFERQSRSSKVARFQITLVSEAPQAGFEVTLMAFSLHAARELVQVLLARWTEEEMTFRHARHVVTASPELLAATRQTVADKLAAAANDFIKELPL